MSRLNPPVLAGTLPSFYKGNNKNDNGATTQIVVPFSMNKTVSIGSVTKFSMKLKTSNTDVTLGVFTALKNNLVWNNNTTEVAFIIPNSILQKMIIGQYYKVQLAYVEQDTVGYYSSVAIIKYTDIPTIRIANFNSAIRNLHTGELVGVYANSDPSEKVYQYKFSVFEDFGPEIETSGWLLHNSYGDTVLDASENYYTIKTALKENVTYRVQYSILTNNNLELKTPKYMIMTTSSIDPELDAELLAELDYENANITVGLKGKYVNGREAVASGAFILSRASSDTGFNIWTVVHDFRLKGQLPSSFLFKDFTIEQGITYRYALQQYNDATPPIYSNRIYAPDVVAHFEDAYLYDGERQLRIRFNTKISSFKTTHLDNKKTTLGSAYPFIFRSGAVAYKEFPINGLLSYAIDNDELFISKQELGMPANWEFTTDIIDENISYERKFKLAVLDWLNNGSVKLFKSPTEGNYLVRLINVSLSPVDQVTRMLHNFTCTANEVAAFTVDNLATYNFLNIEPVEVGQIRWQTVRFADFIEEKKSINAITDITNDSMDLLKGYKCYHLKITDAIPGTKIGIGRMVAEDNTVKNELEIVIGITGQYEIIFEDAKNYLYLLNPTKGMPGQVTYGIYTTTTNRFDTINKINIYDITLQQTFGPCDNLLQEYQDIKHSVSRMYFARFSALEVEQVANLQMLEFMASKAPTTDILHPPTTEQISPYKLYHTIDTNKYYRYNTNYWHSVHPDNQVAAFIEVDNYSTEVNYNGTLLSVEQNNDIYIPELEGEIPNFISIGSGVVAEISFQVKEISYGVESQIQEQQQAYETSYETWRAVSLGYRELNSAEFRQSENCFIFINGQFELLTGPDKNTYVLSATNRAWTYNLDDDNSIIIDQDQIYQARIQYENARDVFFLQLEELVKAKEVEVIQ